MATSTIANVAEDGSRITLFNGRTFCVAPGDIPTVSGCWHEGHLVEVIGSKSGTYPYHIENLDSYDQETIEAASLT